jgi:hypothetical protein
MEYVHYVVIEVEKPRSKLKNKEICEVVAMENPSMMIVKIFGHGKIKIKYVF